jgi:hypothetical protein
LRAYKLKWFTGETEEKMERLSEELYTKERKEWTQVQEECLWEDRGE